MCVCKTYARDWICCARARLHASQPHIELYLKWNSIKYRKSYYLNLHARRQSIDRLLRVLWHSSHMREMWCVLGAHWMIRRWVWTRHDERRVENFIYFYTLDTQFLASASCEWMCAVCVCVCRRCALMKTNTRLYDALANHYFAPTAQQRRPRHNVQQQTFMISQNGILVENLNGNLSLTLFAIALRMRCVCVCVWMRLGTIRHRTIQRTEQLQWRNRQSIIIFSWRRWRREMNAF